MAIAFRASAEAHTTSGGTTITIPGTVQAGDAMVIVGGLNDAGVSDFDWPTPAGWTLLRASRVGADVFAAMYGRVATSGDAGSPVLLDSDSTGKAGVTFGSWSGVDPVAPFHAHNIRVENTSTASHPTPTVDVTVEDAEIAVAAVQGNSAAESWGTASGYTKRQDSVDNDHLGGHITATVQDKTVADLGTYGGEALVAANPSIKAVTFTVALAPAQTTQKSRPTSDIASSGVQGVPTPGPGSGIYARLAANVNTEYAQFADAGSVQVGMAPLADPITDTGVDIVYWACYAGGSTGGQFDFTLKQGATTIATWSQTLTSDFTEYTHTLTTEEAADITDYGDLNVTAVAALD